MLYEIKKGELSFAVDTFGAELHSLRLGGLEYLWQSGEAWMRYAPLLFPFICSPKDRTYRAGGKVYRMKANHGFARDLEFTMTGQTADSVTFELRENAETLAQYPYPFRLRVTYTALPDGVRLDHAVENPGDTPLYFYLGGHPAFNCPLTAGELFTDYYVEYEKDEHITRLIDGQEVTLTDGRIVDITRELFDYDSIPVPSPKSKSIALRSRKSAHSVTLEFPDSECITIWSPTGDDRAAFVCLEPWTSVPTQYDDAEEDIERKPHAIRLAPGAVHRYSYTIRLT